MVYIHGIFVFTVQLVVTVHVESKLSTQFAHGSVHPLQASTVPVELPLRVITGGRISITI